MTTVCTRVIAILMIGIVVSIVGSSVPAGTLYSTDFSDTTTGELPAGWTVTDAYGTWEVDENDELTPSSISDDSTVVWDTPGAFTDGTITATLHNGSGRAGVVFRAVSDEVYYVARVKGLTYMEVYWNDPNQGVGYGRIANVALDPDYVYGDMCTLTVTLDGSSITGEVRNSSDVVMGSFDIVDEHITAAGYAGVRANDTSFGCDTFQIDVVPEPCSVALLFSALAGLLIARRGR
ncbi:MAG: PEP-CTERM sorting domain-containing protein [Pirellulales bacterium]|nr:PEP-CTERM sorting domain-containing protein [Pirellulales bacterium]